MRKIYFVIFIFK